jgi:hypothetical protein
LLRREGRACAKNPLFSKRFHAASSRFNGAISAVHFAIVTEARLIGSVM